MDINTVVDFENIIKSYKVMRFDKVWERVNKTYKLIYNLEGLSKDDRFYPNLKVIFWLDEQLTENVMTYLHALYCDYKSITITTVQETFNSILQIVDKERTHVELSGLILGGTDAFNRELKNKSVNDFAQALNYVPQQNVACINMKFEFELVTNINTYHFYLKCYDSKWQLMYNEKNEMLSMKDVPVKIIQWIYESVGNNI
jgi:hypothetical protein